MKITIVLGMLITGVLVITGCSSTSTKPDVVQSAPVSKSIAEEEAYASNLRQQAEEARVAKQQARMEDTLKLVPDWIIQTPKPDSTGIYASGSGESDKLRVAMKKAMLDAEFGLAKNFNQELSGSERSYLQDNAGTTTTEQYTELVDKLVSQVSVNGFEIVKQEVKPIDGKYNAFVLIKLPYDEFNMVLKEQRAKLHANDKSIKQAFDDLSKRLENRRKQRAEDEKAISGEVTDEAVETAPAIQPAKVNTLPLPAAAATQVPTQAVATTTTTVPVANPLAGTPGK